MRWLHWLPASLATACAAGPDARRAVLLRRLALANLPRMRGLLWALAGLNAMILVLWWSAWGATHGLEVGAATHAALVVHRILWIGFDLAGLVLVGRAMDGQWSTAATQRLIVAAILGNLLFVVTLILPLYAWYPDVSIFYVAMCCLVPLLRLDARPALLVVGLPAGLLIAGVLWQDFRSAINIFNAVTLFASAVLSLVGMRYLFVERVRDLLQRDIISRQQAELGRLALTDELTGLANRRSLTACLDREWRRSSREDTGLAAIMLDIDHFKRYNDTHGHAAGDACLRRVAVAISGCLRRAGDMAARYGGEEFVVLLPGSDVRGARTLAERIRRAVAACEPASPGGPNGRVTVSLGVAVRLAESFDTPRALLARADTALYAAKAAGRDRTCLAEAPEPSLAEAALAASAGSRS